MTTCPISLRGKALHVSLNVSGIDSGLLGGGSVKVEVLDEKTAYTSEESGVSKLAVEA